MRVGILAICKDENEYLEEWILYHYNLGIKYFYIGDNMSKVPIQETIQNLELPDDVVIKVDLWSVEAIGSQMMFYSFAGVEIQEKNFVDWVLVIDIDEFLVLKEGKVQDFIRGMEDTGAIAIGLSWRMYGSNPPFQYRKPVYAYNQYKEDPHIKTLYKASETVIWKDPHFVYCKGPYVNEFNEPITSAQNKHTSEKAWIKHTWTRSYNEFKAKIKRGSGDKVQRNYSDTDFINFNNSLTHTDD
jgi:hypothetical protein